MEAEQNLVQFWFAQPDANHLNSHSMLAESPSTQAAECYNIIQSTYIFITFQSGHEYTSLNKPVGRWASCR